MSQPLTLTFDQVDLGKVVALLPVELEDLAQRQPGAGGVGAAALFQPGSIFDLLLADGLASSELDVGQDGHLTDGED